VTAEDDRTVEDDPTPADGPVVEGGPTVEEPLAATGIERLIGRNRRLASSQARLDELLERHRRRPVVQVSLMLYERDREMAGSVVSSALAFRLFLFVVPLLVFTVGIAGFLGDFVDESDVGQAGIGGTLASQINSALSQPNATRWLAVLGGLFGVVLAGRTLSRVLVAASCLAWRLPVRPKASVRAIITVIGLLLGLAMALVLVNKLFDEFGIAIAGISLAAAFAVHLVIWTVMSLVLPRSSNDPGAVIPGAILVATTLTVLEAVSTLILPDRIARASQVYGAIGASLVALGWLFIVSRVMVLSLAVNAVIHERFGSVSQFVFSLPGMRWLASRSEWLRRFFDLEA
jgi:uncharacterized BrkB/YihY/UPF0761 family membrane protein